MKSNQILKIHIFFLGIVILSWITNFFLEIELVNWLNNSILVIILITGNRLFSKYFKSFKKINFYFLIYPIIIVVGLIGLLFRGIFGALIFSIILYPFNFNQADYQTNDIRIYNEFKGFLSACCNYKVVERRFLIMEKQLGEIQNQGEINFKESKIFRTPKWAELTYQIEEYDENFKSFNLIEKRIKMKN